MKFPKSAERETKDASRSSPAPASVASALATAIVDEELRDAVTQNLMEVLASVEAGADARSKLKAFLTQEQWAAGVTLFRVLRRDEVHMINHHKVHDLVPRLLEEYLRESISANIASGDGRFSKAELVAMQMVRDKYTMWKTMRGFVMPPLQKLTDLRADEWLQDEKVMTRMIADRLIEKKVFDDILSQQFATALSRAGYPASLANGPDEELEQQTKNMLQKIELKAVANKAGLP